MADNTLYLYTSLTAGSSHIVTATARLETILKANKLPFQAIDVATDDACRKLWGRRSRGRKLPGLVKSGMIVGDLEQIEEWNEFGELRMQVNNVEALDSFPTDTSATAAPSATTATPASGNAPPKQSTIKIQSPPSKESTKDDSITVAMRQAGEDAASKAKENNTPTPTTTSSSSTKPTAGPSESEISTAHVGGEKKAPGEEESVRRKSIIGEIAGDIKRPTLVPESAAVSSANLHADNPAALREHHRTSIVSATSEEERNQVAQDLRKSISGGHEEMLGPLRQNHQADKKTKLSETIEQDPFEDEKAE